MLIHIVVPPSLDMLKVDDVKSLLELIPTKENHSKSFPHRIIFYMNLLVKEHIAQDPSIERKYDSEKSQRLFPSRFTVGARPPQSPLHGFQPPPPKQLEIVEMLWGGGKKKDCTLNSKGECVMIADLLIPYGFLNIHKTASTHLNERKLQKKVDKHMKMWEEIVGFNKQQGKPFKFGKIMTGDGLLSYEEAYHRERKLSYENEKTRKQFVDSESIPIELTLKEALDYAQRNILSIYVCKGTLHAYNNNDKDFIDGNWSLLDTAIF